MSRYSKYLDYGTGINKILEDGSRSMTAKLEKALKERSVEILKTIVNSYKDENDTGRALRVDVKNYDVTAEGGKTEPGVPDTSTMPAYTINDSKVGLRGGEDDEAIKDKYRELLQRVQTTTNCFGSGGATLMRSN